MGRVTSFWLSSNRTELDHVCDQTSVPILVHTIVVVMLPTMSSKGTEQTNRVNVIVFDDAIMDNKRYYVHCEISQPLRTL